MIFCIILTESVVGVRLREKVAYDSIQMAAQWVEAYTIKKAMPMDTHISIEMANPATVQQQFHHFQRGLLMHIAAN